MNKELAYRLTSTKSFDEVVENIQNNSVANMFRVLHVHDVKQTLSEKGFERGPLKIIEVCNAGFAFNALNKTTDVAMFMPCKFVVSEKDGKTEATLSLPSLISEMLPDAGLNELAEKVEDILKKVMEISV